MEFNKSQQVIDVNDSPVGIYLGSDIIEGYAKLLPMEMDVPPKRRDAIDAAIFMANKAAVEKSYRLSQIGSQPNCDIGKAALSIRISPPKIETPYDETFPVALLPAEAAALARTFKEGEKYFIVNVSVMWTARWICLPEGGIAGLPRDTITASNAQTHIGDKVFDFGCPHPSFDKVVTKETITAHREMKRYPVESFRSEYPRMRDQMKDSVQRETVVQLNEAIRNLAKCPVECPETQMSVTLGYPESMWVEGEEIIEVQEREEWVYEPTMHRAKIPFNVLSYRVKGKWSWSVQRTCCSE